MQRCDIVGTNDQNGKVSYHIKTAESAYYSNMLFLPLAIPYLSSKEHFSQM